MRDKIREWIADMGYDTSRELIGEIIAAISFFILLFMLSIIGG